MQQSGTLSKITNCSSQSTRATAIQQRCIAQRLSILASTANELIRSSALAFVDEVHDRAHGLKAHTVDASARRWMKAALSGALTELTSAAVLDRVSNLDLHNVYMLQDDLKYTADSVTRKTIDLLIDLAYFKVSIQPQTTKADKRLVNSNDGAPQKRLVKGKAGRLIPSFELSAIERTRDDSLGQPLCKYCHAPTLRYSAFHSYSLDRYGITVVRASGHDASNTELKGRKIFHDLSPYLCLRHAGQREKSAERNVLRMQAELQTFSATAIDNSLFNARPLRIRSYVSWIRAQRATLKREIESVRSRRAYEVTEPLVRSFFTDLFCELGLPDHWLEVTESLTQIELSEDGYFARIYHDGSEHLFEIASPTEEAQWRASVHQILRRLAQILDIEADTDESWLTACDAKGDLTDIPMASISTATPVQGIDGTFIMPRIARSHRLDGLVTGVPGTRLQYLRQDPIPGLRRPGKIVRITLLSPLWLNGMLAARRVKPAL